MNQYVERAYVAVLQLVVHDQDKPTKAEAAQMVIRHGEPLTMAEKNELLVKLGLDNQELL